MPFASSFAWLQRSRNSDSCFGNWREHSRLFSRQRSAIKAPQLSGTRSHRPIPAEIDGRNSTERINSRSSFLDAARRGS